MIPPLPTTRRRAETDQEPQKTPKHHSHSTAREVLPPFKFAKGRKMDVVPPLFLPDNRFGIGVRELSG